MSMLAVIRELVRRVEVDPVVTAIALTCTRCAFCSFLDSAALMAGVVAYVEQLAETVSPKSIATMKAQVYRHLGEGARPALEDSDRLTRASLDHPDAKEGAMALMEKRAPNFQPWTGGA